jgi:hypothetical protein
LLASLDRFVERYTEGTACSDVAPHLCSDDANLAEPARTESCDGDDLFDDLDIDWDASTTTGAAVTPRESNRDGFAMAPSNGSGHSSNRTGRLREAPFLLGPEEGIVQCAVITLWRTHQDSCAHDFRRFLQEGLAAVPVTRAARVTAVDLGGILPTLERVSLSQEPQRDGKVLLTGEVEWVHHSDASPSGRKLVSLRVPGESAGESLLLRVSGGLALEARLAMLVNFSGKAPQASTSMPATLPSRIT